MRFHPSLLLPAAFLFGLLLGGADMMRASAQTDVVIIGPFPDVAFDHPAADAIDYLAQNGIVDGYPDGTFRPEQAINRAEFTKIVIGALFPALDTEGCLTSLPSELRFTRTLIFPDVARHQWFAKYVCKAKVSGMVGGYPDGTFRPAIDVHFAEAAKILAHGFSPSAIAPSDGSAWYEPFVRFLEERRAIPPSLKSFDQILTRGAMAEMIYRLRASVTDRPSQTYESLTASAAQ